jgi:hypothetical protein
MNERTDRHDNPRGKDVFTNTQKVKNQQKVKETKFLYAGPLEATRNLIAYPFIHGSSLQGLPLGLTIVLA